MLSGRPEAHADGHPQPLPTRSPQMSLRLSTSSAALAATILAVALPAGASAHTDAQVAGGFGQPADSATVADLAVPAQSPSTHSDAGTGTVTVIALAGGTLLLGAAGGFGGGRIVTRRRAVA